MSDTKIKTDVKTISEIFEEFWFVIPEYQRSYVWGTDNIKDLLDDLWYAYKKNPDDEYFLGSIVLKKLAYYEEVNSPFFAILSICRGSRYRRLLCRNQ